MNITCTLPPAYNSMYTVVSQIQWAPGSEPLLLSMESLN